MSNTEKGFIVLSRSFFESDLWNIKREFSKLEAWLDLIVSANYKDTTKVIGLKKFEIKRGEFLASIRFLSTRWGWSKGKTERFIQYLKNDQKIGTEKRHGQNVVLIRNYDAYQDLTNYKKGRKQSTKKDTCETGAGQARDKEEINKINKINNIINNIIPYLNELSNKGFKKNSSKTKSLIEARVNDGYTLDDFKKVVRVKTEEWLGNDAMERYLRPETLFGNKFESYLNQPIKNPTEEEKTDVQRKFEKWIGGFEWCIDPTKQWRKARKEYSEKTIARTLKDGACVSVPNFKRIANYHRTHKG